MDSDLMYQMSAVQAFQLATALLVLDILKLHW